MKLLGNDFNITDALLNHLKMLFPNKLPLEHVTPEELGFLRGQQSIIQKLVELQNQDYNIEE
jgi:hypothetical protein